MALEGEMHTCWKQAKQEKIDYLDVNLFHVSLLGKVVEVVIMISREDEG